MKINLDEKGRDPFIHEFLNYLEGHDKIDPRLKTTILSQPTHKMSTLYRLCRVQKGKYTKGDVIKLKDTDMLSASDQPRNAVYAGCSFAHDTLSEKDLAEKDLVLIKIRSSNVYMSYKFIRDMLVTYSEIEAKPRTTGFKTNQQIKSFRSNINFTIARLDREREYIISGKNVTGSVMVIKDYDYLKSNKWMRLI